VIRGDLSQALEPIEVPAALRPILRLYGHETRLDVANALAKQLRLSVPDGAADRTWVILSRLTPGLNRALCQGWGSLDDQAGAICNEAVSGSTTDEAIAALVDLGWGEERLHDVRVRWLGDAVRGRLADKLSPSVGQAIRRWEEAGHFNPAKAPNL